MIKILSYNMPDIDGISCMCAYSELLNKQGKKCEYIIDGRPKKEVEIVCNMFEIRLNSSKSFSSDDKIILVDTNETNELASKINLKNIVEIIDHHHVSEKIKYMPNVKAQIDKVGAAATLVAERYKNSNIEISKNVAILLYYGIVSNTMNFNAKTTTSRDIEMANWLKKNVEEELEQKIQNIFKEKSLINNLLLLREEMDMEYRNDNLNINWSMGQLELVNVSDFIDKNKQAIINIMKAIKYERNIEFLSVNCIDILNGYTVIISIDKQTKKVLTDILDLEFKNDCARISNIVTRKEIFEKIWLKYGK